MADSTSHRETYKHFEIEIVRSGQDAKYTPLKPSSEEAKKGRVRHLYVMVAGAWLCKADKNYAWSQEKIGAKATFGSVDTALAAAKHVIDDMIAQRAKLYREDPAAGAGRDAARMRWADADLENALKELAWYETKLATQERVLAQRERDLARCLREAGEGPAAPASSALAVKFAASRRNSAAALRENALFRTEQARLYAEACKRHTENLKEFMGVLRAPEAELLTANLGPSPATAPAAQMRLVDQRRP